MTLKLYFKNLLQDYQIDLHKTLKATSNMNVNFTKSCTVGINFQ